VALETDSAAKALPTGPGGSSRNARHAWKSVKGVLGVLVAIAFTFLGLLAITFFIGRVVPIDPVLAVVGDRAPRAVYEAARIEMGLDKPLIVQFFHYVGNVLTGDLGMSVSTGKPVIEDLKRVFPATRGDWRRSAIIIGVLARRAARRVSPRAASGGLVDQVIRVDQPAPAIRCQPSGSA
jgi:peptide/nickel transport system permease protein